MKKLISLVVSISVTCSIFAFPVLAKTDTREIEYKVNVLPNSNSYKNYRTDGRFFYSDAYPEHYAVHPGTGASIYNIKGEQIVSSENGYYFVNSDSVFSNGLLCMKQYVDQEEKNGYIYLYNPKYGYIDEYGNVAIDFQYDEAQDFSCGLGVVKKDGKYGCIDAHGNVVIDFLYDNIRNFKDGYAQALLNEEYVTLDTNGNITKGKFDDYRYMSPFVNGYAFVRYSPVYYNGHYANRVDLNGYLQYDERPGGGSLLLQEESGYGFVDEAGNIIYDFVLDANIGKRYEGNAQDAHAVYYFKVSYFTEEGIAVVKQDGKYGVIDTNGNLICDFVYNSVETIGKFIVCTVDGEDILLDKYGNVLFDRGEYDEFKRISNTSEYIMLQKNGKWGVCHIDGEIVVRCEYDTIVPNTNGNSLCVQKDGKYGALSLHAEQLVPLEFEDMPWHSTDTAIVQKEGLYYIYFIPQQKLSDFSFDQIKALPDDDNSSFWAVKSSDKWGVINSNGDWILEPKYVNIMGDAAIIRAIIEASSTSHCEEYYDSNFNLIYYTKDGKTYDSQDREIYSYELAFWDTELIYPPAIYRCGRPTDGMGLMAIFEVPKPQEEVEGNYICMMLDNPLINVCGNVYPMEENNYFFKPVIENDRTLVPMRAIFEALGAEVSWYPEDRTIVAVRGGTTVFMQVDDWYMSVNDEWIRLDAPPRIVNDRTLIPLRAVAEAFGAQVGWDEATQTATVELY